MKFLPTDALTSSGATNRIAIIGPPGSGKTSSLLTFPDLIVFDRDKNTPKGVVTIPAHNPDWADSLVKRSVKDTPNFRDATLKWLRLNHDKFEPEQTFALDSWTFLQDACDLQTYVEEDLIGVNPKTGQKDGYYFWKTKLEFSKKIVEFLKSMKCRVVVTMHETIDRDEQGKVNGKIRPVQDGSFKDQVLGVFNNVWRMRGHMPRVAHSIAPKNPDGTKKEVDLWFYWQLYGDSVIDLKMDNSLGLICRKNKIDKVEILFREDKILGGYQTIQALYDGTYAIVKTQT